MVIVLMIINSSKDNRMNSVLLCRRQVSFIQIFIEREEKIFKFLMWKQWKSKEREIFKKGKYQDFFEKLKGGT